MRYGRRGSRGRGQWPGNGPFRNLPPWERPGWLFGPGSCWYMGYHPGIGFSNTRVSSGDESQILRNQKELVEKQLQTLQESLNKIEERLRDLEEKG